MGSFFGDLALCFDRMKTSLSTIVAMQKGMPRSVCLSTSKTMQNMTMQVRTTAGTSKDHYTNVPGETAIAGEKQGTATAMALWTLQSDSILQTHRRTTTGISMHWGYTDMKDDEDSEH